MFVGLLTGGPRCQLVHLTKELKVIVKNEDKNINSGHVILLPVKGTIVDLPWVFAFTPELSHNKVGEVLCESFWPMPNLPIPDGYQETCPRYTIPNFLNSFNIL